MNKYDLALLISGILKDLDVTNDKSVEVLEDDGDYKIFYRERKDNGKISQYEIRIGGGYEVKEIKD